MNLAAMLASQVTPLSEIVIEPVRKEPKPPRKPKNTGPANAAKHRIAVDKYRSVMGVDWTPTPVIERRLGIGPGHAMENLNKWKSMGLVERRNNKPDEPWARYKGYSWRFVK